jgi:hypothetical protein
MRTTEPRVYDNLTNADLAVIHARLETAPATDVAADARRLLDEVRRLRLAVAVVREQYEELVEAVGHAIARSGNDLGADTPIGYGLTLRAIQTLSKEPGR